MGHRRKREPGPQHHAEGQHGEKTHQAFIEQLQHSAAEPTTSAEKPLEAPQALHRVRQQHDEAEKGS